MIAYPAQITRHHLANQAAPAYSLNCKVCACGKASTAKQLAQQGKCSACVLAAVRDAIMPGDFAKLQHMLGAVEQYPECKCGWRNYFAAGSDQQDESMQRFVGAGLAKTDLGHIDQPSTWPLMFGQKVHFLLCVTSQRHEFLVVLPEFIFQSDEVSSSGSSVMVVRGRKYIAAHAFSLIAESEQFGKAFSKRVWMWLQHQQFQDVLSSIQSKQRNTGVRKIQILQSFTDAVDRSADLTRYRLSHRGRSSEIASKDVLLTPVFSNRLGVRDVECDTNRYHGHHRLYPVSRYRCIHARPWHSTVSIEHSCAYGNDHDKRFRPSEHKFPCQKEIVS